MKSIRKQIRTLENRAHTVRGSFPVASQLRKHHNLLIIACIQREDLQQPHGTQALSQKTATSMNGQ